MTGKYAIYGTGGAARDVVGVLRAQLSSAKSNIDICFVDDDAGKHDSTILGCRVQSYQAARAESRLSALLYPMHVCVDK